MRDGSFLIGSLFVKCTRLIHLLERRELGVFQEGTA